MQNNFPIRLISSTLDEVHKAAMDCFGKYWLILRLTTGVMVGCGFFSGASLSAADTNATITVLDSSGGVVQESRPKSQRGLSRVVWNLRYADVPLRAGGGEDDDAGPRNSTPGPLVMPGTYTVRLIGGGVTTTQRVVVREDPRINVTRAERKAWTDFQRQVAALAADFAPVAERARRATASDAQTIDLKRQAAELLARISTLYNASARWTGRPTADQRTQLAYYVQMAKTLGAVAF